jgi:RimJ/RimL family protein N-acetyltransferase
MYGPVIRGKLVTLRPPRIDEASLMVSWFEDMEVSRFLKRRYPPSIEAEKEWIEDMGKASDDVIWAVQLRDQLIGVTGIHGIDWPKQRGTTGMLIGDKAAWGRGVASEVMGLRTRFAFTQMPLRKLNSTYIEGNIASWRAQEKAGYREVGRRREQEFRDGAWLDEVLTEVLRSDWLAANPG